MWKSPGILALALVFAAVSWAEGPREGKSTAKSKKSRGEQAGSKAAKTERSSGSTATVEGRVSLPKAKEAPVKVQRYTVVSKGGTVAMSPSLAVVYLEGTFPSRPTPGVASMVQKDLMFVPTLLPVQVGTKVEFPNEDDTYHNVFSYSKPKRFDLGRFLPTEEPVPSQVFDKPGLVHLHCDIHEHMQAIVLVLDTPYFVVSDAAGNFRLPELPAGNFTLKAWLSSERILEMPVQLSSGATMKADFP